MHRSPRVRTKTKLLRHIRPLHADVLLESWKETSLRNGWRFEDDWAIPETTHLATAHTRNQSLGAAARELGHARAMQGIGITETIEDLTAFLATSGAPDAAVLQQRLTEGWVVATNTSQPASCTDPLTDLPTYEHFSRVLSDLYISPGFDPEAFVIGRITLPPLPEGATLGWPMLVELGLRCQEAFDGKTASLGYQGNTITVLMQRSNENYLRMIYCQAALTRITGFPSDRVDITYESLTTEPAGVLNAPRRVEES